MRTTLFGFSVVLSVALASPTLAQLGDDTPSDAATNFKSISKDIKAVMVLVPLDEKGNPDHTRAEIRLHKGENRLDKDTATSTISDFWTQAEQLRKQADDSETTFDVEDDTPTWGWWRRWHRHHYRTYRYRPYRTWYNYGWGHYRVGYAAPRVYYYPRTVYYNTYYPYGYRIYTYSCWY